MATMTFDTLRFVDTLKNADFTEKQAKALAEAFKGAWDPSFDMLATKGDIADVRREISEAKVEIIRWVVSLLLAQTGLIIAAIKLF